MFDFTRQSPPLEPLTSTVADVQRHLARAIAVCNELGRLAATAALERDLAVEDAAVRADIENTRDEPWNPTTSDGARASLSEASMAWRPRPTGVFDDAWCGKVYDGLMAYLSDWADEHRRGANEGTVAKMHIAARDLIAYALHLRQHGERAPGGNETWADFDRKAEDFLRRTPVVAWRGFACPAGQPARIDLDHDNVLRHDDGSFCNHHAAEAHQASRGDAVAEWLRQRRERYYDFSGKRTGSWYALDDLLNDYRDHADTGTPLTEPVQGPHPEA
jgi:hypothetical protein